VDAIQQAIHVDRAREHLVRDGTDRCFTVAPSVSVLFADVSVLLVFVSLLLVLVSVVRVLFAFVALLLVFVFFVSILLVFVFFVSVLLVFVSVLLAFVGWFKDQKDIRCSPGNQAADLQHGRASVLRCSVDDDRGRRFLPYAFSERRSFDGNRDVAVLA